MAEPTPTESPTTAPQTTAPQTTADQPATKITPLRCFLGGLVAGAIGIFFYNSAGAIAGIFARTEIHTDNFLVVRMSTAIRTLVIGMFALGAGVFGMAGVGLTGLGLQTLFKKSSVVD
jgi:Protein of unknown function (DUF3082)